MSGNTIGKLFCVTSFGESHGPAIGCVVDGCPPGLAITEADIQAELDRRKPGTSRHVTQRREPDSVEIHLNVRLADRQPRRAAVHHAADGRAVGFAEGGDAEQLADGVTGHGGTREG